MVNLVPADSSSAAVLDLNLIPCPATVSFHGAPLRPPPSMFLHLPAVGAGAVRVRAQVVAQMLTAAGIRTQLASSTELPPMTGYLSLSPTLSKRWEQAHKPLRGIAAGPEGYRVNVTSDGILIQAGEERGFFWACMTVLQLLEDGREVPGLMIEDAPLIANRAVHWDMTGWPPTREYLQQTIENFARYKINLVVLEFERHFAYNSQPGVSHPDALQPNFIQELDQFARDRGITLVPLVHCIGRVGHLLSLEPYEQLREDPRYFDQLCPSLPASSEIFSAMVEDLLTVNSSTYFHIGGNDARFLGVCPACQSKARQLGGRSSLYLDYVGSLIRYLAGRNRFVMLWDDLVQHMTEEQIKWLPDRVVLTSIEYNATGGRPTQQMLLSLERYQKAGRRAWGAPSHSPSSRYAAFDNIDAWTEACEMGLAEGLMAHMTTRDYPLGPLNPPLEVTWPSILYTAERAWGGRRATTRSAFLPRFGARFLGVSQRASKDAAWSIFDMYLNDFPREARELIQRVFSSSTRNQNTLSFLASWCAVRSFQHYVDRFEGHAGSSYASLQEGRGDPFHQGRLRWRIEDLKSRVPDITRSFRERAAYLTSESCVDEYLNSELAFSLSRLDVLGALLEKYPLPDKEFQQPVRL